MPGTVIVRPIEANLTHDTDLITKMNPYCSYVVGNTRVKGEVCKKGGKHPHWSDSVTLPVANEQKVLVELMDKDMLTVDDNIGSFLIDVRELQASGHVSKWYPLYYKNKAAGEILVEAVFQPQANMSVGQGQMNQQSSSQVYQQGQQYEGISSHGPYFGTSSGSQSRNYGQEKLHTSQPQVFQQYEVNVADTSRHSNVWTEQRQIVEPHTFVKEVEVVETRPCMKDIEVMEPVKVLKNVQYTQAVPVMKQIEVVEPHVVVKEVEVMEPRLVTKTIQVVENVPCKRQIEVIEMRNSTQEVDTFEPHTFTKQVEVTEFQPHLKQVEVTQPVTVKKAVEFVEPVITTQTITKELQEPVIIDQRITTEVGPASVIGVSAEYGYYHQDLSLSERQRLSGHQRWVGYETIFSGLNEQEKLWEQQRLARLNEQEWLRERERLMRLNEQDRLREQRGFFSKLTESFKKLDLGGKNVGQNAQNYSQNVSQSTYYHPSPNF